MPNQRKQGKTKVSVWVTEEQRVILETLARNSGLNLSDLIKKAINNEAKKEGIKTNESRKH